MSKTNLENDRYFLEKVKEGIFSVHSNGNIIKNKTEYIIGSKQKGNNYIVLNHSDSDGQMHSIQAHRLVYQVFNGPIADPLLVVNHKDGNKRNNVLSNLELVTHEENNKHARDTGLNLPLKSTDKPNSSFTEEQVKEYRKLYEEGSKTSKEISILSGVSLRTVWSMLARRTYKDIK